MPNNLDQLIALKEHYGVGNMEIADLIGYSYQGISNWFRKEKDISRTTLRTVVLKQIASELASKYPHR